MASGIVERQRVCHLTCPIRLAHQQLHLFSVVVSDRVGVFSAGVSTNQPRCTNRAAILSRCAATRFNGVSLEQQMQTSRLQRKLLVLLALFGLCFLLWLNSLMLWFPLVQA